MVIFTALHDTANAFIICLVVVLGVFNLSVLCIILFFIYKLEDEIIISTPYFFNVVVVSILPAVLHRVLLRGLGSV